MNYNPLVPYKRVRSECLKKNVSLKQMLSDLTLGKNLVQSMKERGTFPHSDNLARIADYLDVSVDYLLGRTDNPDINK